MVQLNHYPLGAVQSYVLKADRGRAVHSTDMLGLDYWVERNLNMEEDSSAARHWDKVRPIRDSLAEDPVLADLHKKAVQWRHDRFEALMTEDRCRDLYGRLLMAAPSQPLADSDAAYLIKMAQKSQRVAAEGSQVSS